MGNKNISLKDRCRQKKNTLGVYSMRKERKTCNFYINVSFLRKYNQENEFGFGDDELMEMANKFTLWEKRFVDSFDNGYEDFREKVVWLDYDEILEMYITDIAHKSVIHDWQNEYNDIFFREKILQQINSIK